MMFAGYAACIGKLHMLSILTSSQVLLPWTLVKIIQKCHKTSQFLWNQWILWEFDKKGKILFLAFSNLLPTLDECDRE